MKKAVVLAVLGACLFLPPVASGSHAGAIDQSMEVNTSQGIFRDNTTFRWAQTFTAGRTGILDEVQVMISQSGGQLVPTGDVTLEIRAGSPTGALLATETIARTTVGTTPDWEVALIDPGVVVTAGSVYAIVLYTTGTGGYLWQGADSGQYTGGQAFISQGNPSSYAGVPNTQIITPHDMTFRTFVAVLSAATFRSIAAARTSAGVLVRWDTASELGTLGFSVYREVKGKRVRANSKLIAAKGRGGYSFLDRTAPKGKGVRYWLQVVDLDGSRSWYGPARVLRT